MTRERLNVLAYNALTLLNDGAYTGTDYEDEDDFIEAEAEASGLKEDEVRKLYQDEEVPDNWTDTKLQEVVFGLIDDVDDAWSCDDDIQDEMGMTDEEWSEYQNA